MWWDAMRSPAARWNHPKAVEKTVPWKPWKTKPRFPTAHTAPWKTRNLGEFPTFPPPCDSPFPSLKKTKGKEGSMKRADRSSVNKSGQIQRTDSKATDSVTAYSVTAYSICGRGATFDRCYDDEPFIQMQIVKNAALPDTPAPPAGTKSSAFFTICIWMNGSSS